MGPFAQDRNQVLNDVAGLMQTASTGHLPLSVRYAAAEAAVAVVESHYANGTPSAPESDYDVKCARCGFRYGLHSVVGVMCPAKGYNGWAETRFLAATEDAHA